MIPNQRTEYPIGRVYGLNELPEPYTDELDADGNGDLVTYIGYSFLGTLETDAKWLIVRKTTSGTVTKYEYPQSSMNFNQVWADRATLNYMR